ncbi:MATE family efflux transporter [Aliirhizobium cellulosilyticum]|uniref:Putative MATE family efflux protein n=1 Tax=Aliirhizobium cellulosilyticum TaxID=393664 RepID=A0A7W6V0H8_9HYPH|nr:putative MATE family efflux protein [Rhizobium cellulosilyticum]MBB4413361.1 putative MATE family efflux protein [Rhizobium cellulosilyticum]MBB4447700.1 putative MATE family efflux protein [Rhizobium cellulosilyticum]
MATATTADSAPSFDVTHREVLRIAIPMMIAHFSTPLVSLVATGVIGQLGQEALIGGVALAAVIFDVLFVTFNFLRGATTGFTAQAFGAGDRRFEQRMLLGGLTISMVAGLVILILHVPIGNLGLTVLGADGAVAEAAKIYFSWRVWSAPFVLFNFVAFGWIIGRGDALTAMLLQGLLNGLNLGLSIWWVLGLDGGVAGLAIASLVSEIVTALAGAAIILCRTDKSSWNLPDMKSLRRLFSVNGDMMIRSFALLIGLSFFTRQSGELGIDILAANTILLRFYFFGVAFLDGIATAAEQLAGRAVGARNRAAFDRMIKLTTLWALVCGALVALSFLAGGWWVIDLASPNATVEQLAESFLPYAAIMPLVGAIAFQMDGVYIGATWSREMRNLMLLSLATYFAAWAVLQPLFGNHGLWIALLLFQSARSIAFRLMLPKLTARTLG